MNGNFTLKDGLVISIGNKSAFPILFERSKVILLYVKMKDLSTVFKQNCCKKAKIFCFIIFDKDGTRKKGILFLLCRIVKTGE